MKWSVDATIDATLRFVRCYLVRRCQHKERVPLMECAKDDPSWVVMMRFITIIQSMETRDLVRKKLKMWTLVPVNDTDDDERCH